MRGSRVRPFVLQCESLTCNCGFFRGGVKPRQGYLGLQGSRCTAPGSSLRLSLPCSDMKTTTLTVGLTTAPQDECLTRCARRPRPGYAAPTQTFGAFRTVQRRGRAAELVFKGEAPSAALSCGVKLYAAFLQLSTASLICCLSPQGAHVQFTATPLISPFFFKNRI